MTFVKVTTKYAPPELRIITSDGMVVFQKECVEFDQTIDKQIELRGKIENIERCIATGLITTGDLEEFVRAYQEAFNS